MKVHGVMVEIIFGPVNSRRYGRSLGVNPLPASLKICNFNCPYCECGWTDVAESRSLDPALFPTVEMIESSLRAVLKTGIPIDNITVCGNGEPTLHPEFPRLTERLVAVRQELAPEAGMVILANSTNLDRPDIVEALAKFDEPIMKLDAGTEDFFKKINLPLSPMSLDELCAALKCLPNIVIQSMFVQGRLCNTSEEELIPWLERLADIKPRLVQVYSLDRFPPDRKLERVSAAELEAIAQRVEKLGISVKVFV
jgi:wyosine [tRNA(Phe)-imidazoG37] synthetase (radical SAM superfamily)